MLYRNRIDSFRSFILLFIPVQLVIIDLWLL
jgi:hypothetical protein